MIRAIFICSPRKILSWFTVATLACSSATILTGAQTELPAQTAVRACLEDRENASKASALNLVARAAQDPQKRRTLAHELTHLAADPSLPLDKRNFLCQMLALVGDSRAVPVLTSLLHDASTSDAARIALEAIPEKSAAKALRKAMTKLEGNALAGVIHSLGARRDKASIRPIARLITSGDATVAGAALRALGSIGTKDCAAILQKAQANLPRLHQDAGLEAQLACAARLAADGDTGRARALYRKLYTPENPTPVRLGALRGLIVTDTPLSALADEFQAISSDDQQFAAGAIALSPMLKGEIATRALLAEFNKVTPETAVLLIQALADRRDPLALPVVLQQASSTNKEVRLAAIQALGSLGSAGTVGPLLELASGSQGELSRAAEQSLEHINATGVNDFLSQAAGKGETSRRIAAIKAVSARRQANARDVLFQNADDPDKSVRIVSLTALSAWVTKEDYPAVVRFVAKSSAPDETMAAQQVLEVAGKGMDSESRLAPLLPALEDAKGEGKLALLQSMGSIGGPEALAVVVASLNDPDADVRDIAVRTLGDWPDEAAADALYELAQSGTDPTQRELAARGFFRTASSASRNQAELLKQGSELARGPAMKKLWLSSLGSVTNTTALELALQATADPEVSREAEAAVLNIAPSLIKKNPAAVKAVLERVRSATTNETVVKNATTWIQRAESPVEILSPIPYPASLIAARIAALKERADVDRLLCYLDCGAQVSAGEPGGPGIAQLTGTPWWYPGSEAAAPGPFGSITFDGAQVPFVLKNLDPAKRYALGFSWWDYDANGRIQSVDLVSENGARRRVVEQQPLPAFVQGQKPPLEYRIVLQPADYTGGKVTVHFIRHAGPNAVVSEVWLNEAPADAAPGTSARPAFETKPPVRAAVNLDPPAGDIKVLIVTGIDYPGHPWKETAPALKAALEEDARLGVRIAADPEALASPNLHLWDVVVLHFMDWEIPGPGAEARNNLIRFVSSGKGLVLTHFACGAWDNNEWPEFRKLAGRIWDPKLRAHDPHGTFRVEIADPDHPVTRGLSAFDTLDELYTCLAGETAIHVLAKATSKVDLKEYPIAFVLDYGNGRVFHSVLGHDARAYASQGVRELLRRGVLWAAGQPASSIR